ncbi:MULTISPECIES: cytochrome P450 [unclassified Novosphingobium]|uniref:cytochrome P450 n=1 Tax=unclassified Novosphingobium TaxID=2644732 RepID=UPI0025E86AA7|nr:MULTISPECIES: cytochrome P450 [unclassified Novosphingobium]HQV02174.1 cytochrome P450 [Novosphingobium sp.]
MPKKIKYFAGIAAAQAAQKNERLGTLSPFDFEAIATRGRMARFKEAAARRLLLLIYPFARRFKPLLKFGGVLHVTRAEQVREVLSRPDDFNVPFGPEMGELGDGAIFLLGLDGPPHDRMLKVLRAIVRREDAERMAAWSFDFAESLLENHAGRIDVVGDLIKRVPAEICLRYFGLSCDEVDAFADWTVALSALLFGDPTGKPEVRKLAMNAKRRLGIVLDDAIARTKTNHRRGLLDPVRAETLVERLVLIQDEHDLSDIELRAILMGMATGFIPTNSLAASNMLTVLLEHPEAFAMATQAARSNDRETMRRIVLEAGRMKPALSPGQWRHAPRDTYLAVDGRLRAIKGGTTLLVSTMSAMRDPREVIDPGTFRIDRTNPDGSMQDPDLVFGAGSHVCIGKHLAIEQISALFTALLRRDGLRVSPGKAGRLRSIGSFPRSREMVWDTPASQQSMFLVIVPIANSESKDVIDRALAGFGNPAGPAVKAALDATGLVHFCSLATIQSDVGLHLVFELSVDGTPERALETIAADAGDVLRPAFALAGLGPDEDLAHFLKRHIVELHGKPWGATGLNYNGLSEFSVKLVEKQARFADFAGRVLRDYVASETARGSHPMLTLAHLRRVLRHDPAFVAEATPAQLALIDEAKAQGYDVFHLMAERGRFKLTSYRETTTVKALGKFLVSRDGRIVLWPVLALLVLFGLSMWPMAKGLLVWKVLATLAKAVLATGLVIAVVVGLFLARLRHAEKTDVPDTSEAPLSKLRAIMEKENPPGFAQNHIMAVGKIKPGPFRAFTHAFALWGIRNLIAYRFRPGLVRGMGTIHYARWWRLPGTDVAAFYSNFDGSWESYLEDFISRAHRGQTASWSNWQGFPRTKFMIKMGADDGDAFKRWERIQQQVVPFWYSRFPALSSEHVRNNALIHSGVALAKSATDCEEWLRCFGSMPRVANRIETDEVQALVFRGLKRLPYSVALAVRLPVGGEALGEWLCWIRGKAMQAELSLDAGQLAVLVDEGVLLPVARSLGRPGEYALAHAMTVAFGDRPLTGDSTMGSVAQLSTDEYDRSGLARRDAKAAMRQAVFLGLSAAGMARFNAPNTAPGTLLEAFPSAYRMGMAARARINGDIHASGPEHWRWQDDPYTVDGTEAVLMLYASTPAELARLRQVHELLLLNHGGTVLSATDCAPAFFEPEKIEFEHFGYRDGISQPVIRGTSRSIRSVPERDVVEPGEFILGYKDSAGYFPPSPLLPREADVSGALPVPIEANLSRFPDFGEKSLSEGPRDLGRNGTYLVLRELKQDVAGFEAFVEAAADQLNNGALCELYRLTGQAADKDWIKAKLMGRWPNGRPLIGNPVNVPSSASTREAEHSNDFVYGEDDPQGLACPFGSHIRRTNPRDSRQPGDVKEQEITNRHRLLRRGRTYVRAETGEKGLLFASICADIERQFEFVQQFWANAPAFHGLAREPDPIAGSDPLDPASGCPIGRVFTIPTAAGPVQLSGLKNHVQTMGGGYFFMPSRSALGWLTESALRSAAIRNAAS